MIYLCFYSLIALICLIALLSKKHKNNISNCIFAFVCMILIFDFAIGQDLGSYVFAFDRVSTPIADAFKYHIQRNVGFNMLLYYSKQVMNNYAFFRFLFNLIVVGLCSYTIVKKSKNYLMSILIFIGSGIFIVYFGSGIRQMLGMSIFFFAFYNFLLEKKYKMYYLFAIISMAFHEAGLVMLLISIPIIYFSTIKEKQNLFIVITSLCSIGCFIVFSFGLPLLFQIFGGDSTLTHVLLYFNETSIDFVGIALRSVLMFINVILYLMVRKQDRDDNDYKMILTMVTIFFVYISLSNFSLIARIYDFVAIIELIMIPNFLMKIEGKRLQSLAFTGVVGINFFLMFMDIRTLASSGSVNKNYTFYTLPYISIFDSNEINKVIGE